MRRRKTALFIAVIAWCGSWNRPAGSDPIGPDPSHHVILEANAAADFHHDTGQKGHDGWELDYKRDRPGYALSGLHFPLPLDAGVYRVTTFLRKGHYPTKGLLRESFPLFRLEIWDATAGVLLQERTIHLGDLDKPNRYEPRWIEFSTEERAGHAIEPRVHWAGLVNGEVGEVRVERFADADWRALEEKAERLGEALERQHLENGYVVSRKPDGTPDETGDATTYTGFYVASLAWKYAATKDDLAYQALENGLQALHNAVKGTPEEPVIVRFVDADGNPFPKSPSKDVYTAFFLAMAAAHPHIRNEALKKQMAADAERIGTKLLQDRLTVRSGSSSFLNLTPHFTEEEIRSGLSKLFADKKKHRDVVKALKSARKKIPLVEPWPGIKDVLRALERQDSDRLLSLVVPTLNGVVETVERARDILREQYRRDLWPWPARERPLPGKDLEQLLSSALEKFPRLKNGDRFNRLSDFRVLASNALIALHIIKTAGIMTGVAHFEEYYRTNLYAQDALLKTVMDWYGFEERIVPLTAGQAAADRARRGYLSALSLMNLIQLETNPAVRESYQRVLKQWYRDYRHDDNPLALALQFAGTEQPEPVRARLGKMLTEYPENRVGFGPDYWVSQGEKIADAWGGGHRKGYSREPLPIDRRPKDSFLWQRNARRLNGDEVKSYPPTDFLFVYWFGRYHGILPKDDPPPNARNRPSR